ncbi:hypothetical protein LTR85_006704 [Meristemomyces frigidus]|nr:hypothetical protein LTR85_006704 [Meristemomyces frigidus]
MLTPGCSLVHAVLTPDTRAGAAGLTSSLLIGDRPGKMARYWELALPEQLYNKSELQALVRESTERQIPNLSALKAHQLAEIVKRMQKGLRLHLHGDSTHEELYAEVEAADVELSNAKATRQELIAVLDTIESQRTFHQFAELPPELRQRIYTFAFSYSDNASHLQQPAVSRASKLLRTECLPVFYEVNRFGLDVSREGGWRGTRTCTRQLLMDMWPYYISQEHIAMMRCFEVDLLTDKSRVRVKIGLPTARGETLAITVWSITPEKYMTAPGLRQCQQLVDQQMRPVIEGLLRGPGIGKFTTRELGVIALSAPIPIEINGAKPKDLLRL